MPTTTSKAASRKGSASSDARTGIVSGRRSRTNASASGEVSTPTTVPNPASQPPFPPGPHPASRMRRARGSQGARTSATSARVLRYHQCSSSAAATRAYSSTSTARDRTTAGNQWLATLSASIARPIEDHTSGRGRRPPPDYGRVVVERLARLRIGERAIVLDGVRPSVGVFGNPPVVLRQVESGQIRVGCDERQPGRLRPTVIPRDVTA